MQAAAKRWQELLRMDHVQSIQKQRIPSGRLPTWPPFAAVPSQLCKVQLFHLLKKRKHFGTKMKNLKTEPLMISNLQSRFWDDRPICARSHRRMEVETRRPLRLPPCGTVWRPAPFNTSTPKTRMHAFARQCMSATKYQ